MDIKLYNTLTRNEEVFTPIRPGEVGMYNCGPTVYHYAHIGNLRAYVFADILRRTLEYSGLNVTQIINITDVRGNMIAWGSPGKSGFKGSRKSTPFAAQIAAETVGKSAYDAGVRKIEVHLKGAGNGRESSIRALAAAGLKISAIKDFTAIPHNGCRPPKRRRV